MPQKDRRSALHALPEKKAKAKVLFPIVGIGASAGGLEAFTEFLNNLPEKTKTAFVLIQHLSAGHESILVQLLARTSHVPVIEVKDGMIVEPGHAYVIPPGKDMTIANGVLKLNLRSDLPGSHLPVDYFFESLARDRGSRAMGVILSGSASDGVIGMRAIKAEGGITFAQVEKSAKYDGMPHSSIIAGCVDFVMTPGEIAKEIARIEDHPCLLIEGQNEVGAEASEAEALETESQLQKIFTLLRKDAGVDFSLYKRSTIMRRVSRRMILHKCLSLGDYLKILGKVPAEVKSLGEDLTIHVTNFFRDPALFKALKEKVFPKMMKGRSPDDPVRIWVPGCSTGEEPYSVAIALLEYLGDLSDNTPIQIFGSDVSEAAIDKARSGAFVDSIAANVSPERLRRFFVKTGTGYKISKPVREMCIFAKHDITRDPPFSRMDLISCRNVLIYMGTALQRRILPVFHYALKPSGFLVLGSAEGVGASGEMFAVADAKNRIYSRKMTPTRMEHRFEVAAREAQGQTPSKAELQTFPQEYDFQRDADRIVLARFAPAGVVVNDDMRIVQFRGHTGPYLEPSPGQASLDIFKMARNGLLPELKNILTQARKSGRPASKGDIRMELGRERRSVSVDAVPMKTSPTGENFYLVLFRDTTLKGTQQSTGVGRAEAGRTKKDLALQKRISELEREVESTRSHLQSIVEERETTTEELKSANEEIQSSNEELQSTNEELETAKEELQSANEELTTINEELANKNAELGQTYDDLNNFIVSTNLPMVFVARDLRIRRFTPMAEKLFNIIDTDLGRSLGDLRPNVDLPDLSGLVADVIETLKEKEMEVAGGDGRCYSLRARPYRTSDHRIDGAVLSLIDVDEMKRTERRIDEARAYAEDIVNTIREPLVVLDQELVVVSANKAFYNIFNVKRENTAGALIYDLGDRQWDIPELRRFLEEILPTRGEMNDFRVEHEFPAAGRRIMLLNARRIVGEEKKGHLILLAIEDVTERIEMEERIAESELKFRQLFENMGSGGCIYEARDGGEGFVFRDFNKSAERIEGIKRDDLLGKDVREVFSGVGDFGLLDVMRRVFKTGAPEKHPVTHYRDGRIEGWRENYVFRLPPGEIVTIYEDMTEIKRAELERLELLAQLEAKNLEMERFSYSVAHDLKSPLISIDGFMGILEKAIAGGDVDKVKESIDKIRSITKRMGLLLSQVLKLASLGRLLGPPEEASMMDIANEALEQLNGPLAERGVEVMVAPDLPVASCDRFRLVEVMQNLIGNAIKYMGDQPAPLVEIGSRRDECETLFFVKDNGIGIEERYKDKVFGLFSKFDAESDGVGAGLAIAKRIIDAHGGRIWVESDGPGKGSTFCFTLPVNRDS
jgi:two-component system CheB/CheR fusion protein